MQSGSLMMRSQLDCYDPRLPGTGVFDIKTRACLPIRYDRANYIVRLLIVSSRLPADEQRIRHLERAGALICRTSESKRIAPTDRLY